MNSRLVTGMAVMGVLALAGGALHAVVKPVADSRRERHGSLETSSIGLSAASRMSVVMLGGFRVIAADLVWLKAYIAWERRDISATESLLELATVLDGRPLNFWLNGARIVAFDIPAWRIEEAHSFGTAPEIVRSRISKLQAQRAISFLERGLALHPTSAALWIERANIELNCLHDPTAAAESYRRASEQPNAPYYPARIYAELLRRLGRQAEALAWLVELYPRLPLQVESAAAEVVLGRIRQIEDELSISPAGRFRRTECDDSIADRSLTPVEVAD